MCGFWKTERSWIESLNETHGCDNWSLRKEFTGAIMNLATAIDVFFRQSLRVGGFPFDIRMERPNKETIAAMLEAEKIARDPSVKRYSNVEDALRR